MHKHIRMCVRVSVCMYIRALQGWHVPLKVQAALDSHLFREVCTRPAVIIIKLTALSSIISSNTDIMTEVA